MINLIKIEGSNSSIFDGFTFTGQITGGDWNHSVFRLTNGANIKVQNSIVDHLRFLSVKLGIITELNNEYKLTTLTIFRSAYDFSIVHFGDQF